MSQNAYCVIKSQIYISTEGPDAENRKQLSTKKPKRGKLSELFQHA